LEVAVWPDMVVIASSSEAVQSPVPSVQPPGWRRFPSNRAAVN